MKIYSDHLTRGNILSAAPVGTEVVVCDIVYCKGDARKTSPRRKRENCFNIRLSGNAKSNMWNRRERAATWDEWGIFVSNLFLDDPQAIIGNYNSPEHFEQVTATERDRVKRYRPEDAATHTAPWLIYT